jgi:hypothetical protein
MKKSKIIKSVSICMTLLLISSLSCKKEKEEQKKESSILTVQTVLGEVTVQSGNDVTTPVAGSAIKENSIIKTGKLSLIDLKYKNSGIIRINENSNINVERLFSSETADETILNMDEGKVFVTVSKLLKDSKFQVKTPTSVAGIRGTAFRVSSEKGISRVDVLTGRVKVNPVKDDIVVENIETIVEPDKSVEIDKKDIVSIVEEKKEIEIVSLQKEEIATIKEEAKFMKLDETFTEGIKTEIKEMGIESRPAEDIKDNKKYEEELTKQLLKVQEDREAALKEEEAVKAREEAEKKVKESKEKSAREKEARQKEEKASKEKARLEKIESEKQAQELARQQEIEKQEKIKEEKRQVKKKEEERVKNIPNF